MGASATNIPRKPKPSRLLFAAVCPFFKDVVYIFDSQLACKAEKISHLHQKADPAQLL